jgi:hypothetical protein
MFSSARRRYKAMVSVVLITLIMATLIAGMVGCGGGAIRIYSWFGLSKVRNDLGASYILMNDLDSTTVGYLDWAGPTTHGGAGWDPIGSSDDPFTGTFDGNNKEIRDVVINRPTRDNTGLFGAADNAIIENLGVVNITVTGHSYVGGLAGMMENGSVDNCYFAGNVTGESPPHIYEDRSLNVGGLAGALSATCNISNCHATGSVTGFTCVGGLVGRKGGDEPSDTATLSNSYSSSNVYGLEEVGGLIGYNRGDVSDSYFTGNVTGPCCAVGGLVGNNQRGGHIINSHYSYDEVLINGGNVITIGALFDDDFEEWLANDKFLDINERLSQEEGDYYAVYLVTDVSDLKEVVTFGQDSSLHFRLQNDLDLADEPDFYIPYLAGGFDGGLDVGGHNISNLSVHLDFAFGLGLFGYVADGAAVYGVGAENVSIAGSSAVGGLVGHNDGWVAWCHSTGSVHANGYWAEAGGLVGFSDYNGVEACYSSCDVSGVDGCRYFGGLIGRNKWGEVTRCYATGSAIIQGAYIGGLVGWNEGGEVEDCYATGIVWGSTFAGGLVGGNDGTVSNSYSACTDPGGPFGGLVGYLSSPSGSTVDNSFWDTEVSGQDISNGGTGKNTTEMKDIVTFTDTETEGLDEPWDIIAVADPGIRNDHYDWNIVDDVTYPFLSWQPTEPQPDDPLAFAAVLDDHDWQLTYLLRANDFWTDQRDWDVISDIGDYDVVVANLPDDPGETTFQAFLDAADANGVGVVFTSSWDVYDAWGISLLEWYLSDPGGQQNSSGGDVYYKVTQDHAIFNGWTVDDEITIITGGDCDYAWFSGYSGTTIAEVGNSDYGIKGDAVAVSTYGASTHVLLASLGPQYWTDVTAWTDDGKTILVNAVSFAAGI